MVSIQNALVVGAGTMGAGIAEVLAKAEIHVALVDQNPEVLEAGQARITKSLKRAVEKGKLTEADAAAVLGRITPLASIQQTQAADLMIEAVFEDIGLKKKIVGEVADKFPSAILGTNTSSLSITEIAAASSSPQNVIGTHFFNPPPIMPLLEIIRGEQTSDATLNALLALAQRIGKTPIVVKDIAGFATSRLGIILGMEAIRMLEQGVASAVDIDNAMHLGYKHPMGPLKLTDLVGLDVRLAIAEHLTEQIGSQFTPPPLLRKMVAEGKLGKKSGEGFYLWSGNEATPKSIA